MRRRRIPRHRRETPLMLVADDRYPGQTIEALARWIYRYRSELAPFGLALATLTAAAILHARHPGWWVAVLIVSTGTAVAGPYWLDRPAERTYAATVVVLAGTWLAAATAFGPGTRPLPQLLVAGTLLAGIPWWRHRRRRARVRVERTLAAWPTAADAIGLPGSRVLSAVVDRWGWRARIGLQRGQTAADALNRLPAIESGLRTRPGAVRVEPDPDRADRFSLRVLDTDPHAKPVRWPGPSVTSITQPVELGIVEDGTPVRVLLLRRHALLGGIAGSGKSGVLNVILGNLTACPDVTLWGIDLKGGMELRPWTPCLDRLATTPTDAARLLADAVRILDARATESSEHGQRLWEPTPGRPAVVVIIDEYAELAEETPEATTHADSIARRGRAVAVTLLAATQRPTQDAMGNGAVRSQMDIRLCLRVRERRDIDLVLGQGMYTAGWHAHTLDAPGKFLLSTPEHPTPHRARAFLLTDLDVRAAASHHGTRRTATHEHHQEPPGEPETALWAALAEASAEGRSVPDLMEATGMGRTWVYDRLQEHATARRVTQVSRGRWRATP